VSISVSLDTAKLDAILATVKENRDQVVRACAADVLVDARKKAPVDTGHLRDNSDINTAYQSDGFVNVEFHAEYAPYVELGTRKMRAQPFLTPAMEKAKDRLVQLIKEGLIK